MITPEPLELVLSLTTSGSVASLNILDVFNDFSSAGKSWKNQAHLGKSWKLRHFIIFIIQYWKNPGKVQYFSRLQSLWTLQHASIAIEELYGMGHQMMLYWIECV